MTRAMQRLYLIHAEMRTLFGIPKPSEPSRFLAALPPERLRFVDSLGMTAHANGPAAVRAWSGAATRVGQQTGRPERKQFGPLLKPASQPRVSTAKAKYGPGDRVRHETLGDGTVLASIMSRAGVETVTIDFGEKGRRLVIANAAPMERVI
jgi:DNA helicase-2/ATP-dependent DNA helicase PcrA